MQISFYFIILSFVFLSRFTFSQNISYSSIIKSNEILQEKVYNEDFKSAFELVDKMSKEGSNGILVSFLYSSIYYWQYLVQGDKNTKEKFLTKLESTINNLESLKNKNNLVIRFLLGASYGYKGLYYFEEGELFSAINIASDGVDNLNKAYLMDSSLIDCCYGLGIYNYNAGNAGFFVRLLLPIFFNSADKEEGISLLEKSAINGKLTKVQSHFVLSQIYEKEGDFNKSLSSLSGLVKDYPQSSTFTAHLLQNMYNFHKQYDEVIVVGTKYLESISMKELEKKYFGDIIIFLVAKAFEKKNDFRNAKIYLSQYLEFNGKKNFTNEAKELLIYYNQKIR